MYGKYSLFYESYKNQGYFVHAQTVSTRPFFGGSGLGTWLGLPWPFVSGFEKRAHFAQNAKIGSFQPIIT